MKKVVKAVLNGLFICIVMFCMGVFAFNRYYESMGVKIPNMFGLSMATVETGSMEPNIHVGSLIFMSNWGSYSKGDVVTYINSDGIPITHRIVSIDGDSVTTKGDANSVPDPKIYVSSIVGRVEVIIPYLGYVPMILRSPITISIVCTSLFWCVVIAFILYNNEQQKELYLTEKMLAECLLKEEAEENKPIKRGTNKKKNSTKSDNIEKTKKSNTKSSNPSSKNNKENAKECKL